MTVYNSELHVSCGYWVANTNECMIAGCHLFCNHKWAIHKHKCIGIWFLHLMAAIHVICWKAVEMDLIVFRVQVTQYSSFSPFCLLHTFDTWSYYYYLSHNLISTPCITSISWLSQVYRVSWKLTFMVVKPYICCYFKSQVFVVSSCRFSGHFTHSPPGWVTKPLSVIVPLQPFIKHILEAAFGIMVMINELCSLNSCLR